MKGKLFAVIRLLLAFLCLLGLFSLNMQLAVYRNTASIRLDKPLTAAQAERARLAAAQQGLDLALWRQETGRADNEIGRSAGATALACSGQVSLCLPVTCCLGSLPSGLDARGCAVSTGLADQLWGSREVIGLHLNWMSLQYTVTGVFEDDEAVFVYLCRDVGEYSNLELGCLPQGNPSGAVDLFMLSLGVGGQLIPEGMIAVCCTLLCWLPLFLAGMSAAGQLLRFLTRIKSNFLKGVALLLFWSAAAVSLPGGLAVLPRWIIPGKWSDFTFWRTLGNDFANTLYTVLFTLSPSVRDIMFKKLFLLWLLCLCVGLVVLWHCMMRTKGLFTEIEKHEKDRFALDILPRMQRQDP